MRRKKDRELMEAINAMDAMYAFSDANIAFTMDVYKVLANGTGNLFFSPISMQVILALVYFGARGETADELERGLHLPTRKQATEDGISAAMRQLNESENVMLDIANRVFPQTGFTIKDEFTEIAAKFLAGVEQLDFTDTEQARRVINQWIENKTHDKIQDMIKPGVLKPTTLMVLVNAIYFKGEWVNPFIEDATSPTAFHLTSETTKDVDMMYVSDHFPYADVTEYNLQALLLPYKGNRLSMLIFLPNEVNGLQELENNLANANVLQIMKSMTRNEVYVYLPKFKMEWEKSLKDSLKALGMVSMFDSSAANFSGITDSDLFVDEVLHKAFIEVNERGTEAAAATVVLAVGGAAPGFSPPPVTFKADHPFVFFILDRETEAILFAGRCNAPTF